MKKALPNTKVTVKLRRSNYKEEWYLIIESYPVYKRGSKRASRVVESINRTISTPIWDKSSIARILPDGTFNYKPKRDLNGIIQCRSTIDQEACIYADNVRKLRQHEYDSAILYTDKENEIAAQNERSEQDFIKYFNRIISTRHPNSSDSIIVNWRRVGELLKMYSQGQPIPFKAISVKLLEDIKMFLLRAPMGGNKKGTISQNTASTYFSILKAGLKQAFIDEYLTVDISAKVKGITNIEKPRVALTMNEVQMLVDTPCKDDVLKRAFLFSILTGLRHSDIQTLKWKQIQQTSKGTWQAVVIQQKTKRPDYKPVIQQALQLCGIRPNDDETLVFEAINQLMEENSFYYQELLRAYSHVQVKLIEAIAQERQVSQINAGEFISKYGLKNASSINRALSKLIDNEVVYKSGQYYIIYDRLMGLWLSRSKG